MSLSHTFQSWISVDVTSIEIQNLKTEAPGSINGNQVPPLTRQHRHPMRP
jgi:hypothetical protein